MSEPGVFCLTQLRIPHLRRAYLLLKLYRGLSGSLLGGICRLQTAGKDPRLFFARVDGMAITPKSAVKRFIVSVYDPHQEKDLDTQDTRAPWENDSPHNHEDTAEPSSCASHIHLHLARASTEQDCPTAREGLLERIQLGHIPRGY